MIDWNKHMHSKSFITDLGTDLKPMPDGEMQIGRYAVWSPITNSNNHQIIEVGDDLEMLIEKYHISEDRVCQLVQQSGKMRNKNRK